MLRHMEFSCWISSGDAPFQTYNEESLGNKRCAWIASVPGKTFAVYWQDHSGRRIATSGHVFIDGKDVASAIIRPGRETPVRRTGAKAGRNVLKPFVFSELSLTDDETIASPFDSSLRDIGTIRIEITRVRLGDEVPFSGYEEAQNHGPVHEQAKKAGAHCTKFGKSKRVANARTVSISTAPYDPNEPGPYVVFEFRYRSLDVLKATGVIQTGRKRLNDIPEDAEVIEIESSDDEDPSSTLHGNSSSPRTTTSVSPSKKRVKTEPQADDLFSFTQTSLLIDSGGAQTLSHSHSHSHSQSRSSFASPSFDYSTTQTALESQSQPDETQPDDTRSSSTNLPVPPPTTTNPTSASRSTTIIKQEPHDKLENELEPEDQGEDEDEELDMLAGDSQDTCTDTTYQSQNAQVDDSALTGCLPPPSSSPGPQGFVDEEEEYDEDQDERAGGK